ncbi:hypothetical protein QE152_g37416 [Popillia japonica]|uniref:Uncharacterized protein n=1 Tax=Popillia japonica TaxID=7064 RepID=A0AAW1IAK0_POPJA
MTTARTVGKSYTPQDIMPILKAGPRQNRIQKRGKTMILTATQNLNDLKTSSTTKNVKPSSARRKLLLNENLRSKKPEKVGDSSSSDGDVNEDLCQESSDSEDNSRLGILS